MSDSCVLLQLGSNPITCRFEDPEGRPAFTMNEITDPNLLVKLTRESQWAELYPEIMGPAASVLYFGPSQTPGYIVYGNGPSSPMTCSMRQKKENSTSRYFWAPNGNEYKWRISTNRMECVDGRTVLAVWERNGSNEEYHNARLIINPPGLPIVTEILTTLLLHRIAQTLKW